MDELDEILRAASKNLAREYFQLPIAGREDPIYRERVYCYELYHQMRVLWPRPCFYSLSGEVDKAGHPLIRGNELDRAKPDFLVHIPGNMGGNYAVVEVKMFCAPLALIEADLRTLSAFLDHAGYRRGICYIIGELPDETIDRLLGRLHERSELWIHRVAGASVVRVL